LATQSLVIFVIRTRRVPFFSSRPSLPLLATTMVCVAVGAVVPFSPLGRDFGFTRLPWDFFLVLAGLVLAYLFLVELAKARFFRPQPGAPRLAQALSALDRTVRKRVSRWSRKQP
jgi:Mg2+-importing ATPase